MMRSKNGQTKLMKIITMPVRVLKKGRDMYVRSMMDFSSKPRYSTTTTTKTAPSVKYPAQAAAAVSGLPKSFSTSVTSTRSTIYEENEDLRELIRANSTTTTTTNRNMNTLDVEALLKQLVEEQKISRHKLDKVSLDNMNLKLSKSVPRSFSVGLGRIDEGRALETFKEEDEEEIEEDVDVKKPQVLSKSKSYAV